MTGFWRAHAIAPIVQAAPIFIDLPDNEMRTSCVFHGVPRSISIARITTQCHLLPGVFMVFSSCRAAFSSCRRQIRNKPPMRRWSLVSDASRRDGFEMPMISRRLAREKVSLRKRHDYSRDELAAASSIRDQIHVFDVSMITWRSLRARLGARHYSYARSTPLLLCLTRRYTDGRTMRESVDFMRLVADDDDKAGAISPASARRAFTNTYISPAATKREAGRCYYEFAGIDMR